MSGKHVGKYLVHNAYNVIVLQVQPQNGPNSQFLFKGTGATENANMKQTYGSFMYSYSATEVRMYHPPFPILNRANGLLLDISNIWGNGTNNQRTNDVKLRVEIIQPASFCKLINVEFTDQL